jgi:GIY-YIG catalytic domain
MPPKKNKPKGAPQDVEAIRQKIRAFLDSPGTNGKKIGCATWGVYAFYDYDGEPIYVGQTYESLQERISRHLTNQRSDAVAMNVLDPFEVADIEVWPLWNLEGVGSKHPAFKEAKRQLDATEYTVFQLVLSQSSFQAVLNEGVITPTDIIGLPPSVRGRIIPDGLYEQRKHPDVRIARRATTIAALARVISERELKKPGLRRTLMTQAKRLERLATQRHAEMSGTVPKVEPGEEV